MNSTNVNIQGQILPLKENTKQTRVTYKNHFIKNDNSVTLEKK